MKLIRELNEGSDGSKKDIELKIEQLADQMEQTENEGEQEEIHAELERLSMKLDRMM